MQIRGNPQSRSRSAFVEVLVSFTRRYRFARLGVDIRLIALIATPIFEVCIN